jgi:hypothetical protein
MPEREMTMVERCAKAIYEKRNGAGCTPWSRQKKAHQAPYLGDAKAAIEEMRNPSGGMEDWFRDIEDDRMRSGIIDRSWLPILDPWREQATRPWDHKMIQIFREGWDEPQTLRWDEMHPQMNAEGLFWKPAQSN